MPASIIAVGIFCLLVTARAAACRRWPLLGIFGGAACGLAGLGAVALLGPLTGVALPLNALTAGTAVILGLPGVILLMVLNLLKYYFLRQYRIIPSADTASEFRQRLSQKRR